MTVNGGRVPTSAQAQGPHTYAISFTPREPVIHTVDLRFNGEDVPGSPFNCQVISSKKNNIFIVKVNCSVKIANPSNIMI